jgi:hypothetical protein
MGGEGGGEGSASAIGPEATSLDGKSQCLANPSVSPIRLADEKSKRN